MSDTPWIAGQAVAGTLAFGAVAWQAYRIRQGNEVAQRALIASEAVAIDAARARLDAQAPAVSVRLTDEAWPPHRASQFGVIAGEWPAGYEWHFPAKESERIVLQARVLVENMDPNQYASVEYGDNLIREKEGRRQPVRPHVLWPRGQSTLSRNLFLQKDFTVKELSENYEARQEGRPLPHRVTGTVTVHERRDNGVTDTWELELTGCPVRPDRTRSGIWVVDTESGVDSLEFESHPTHQRTYWLSRRRGERLPEPTYHSGDTKGPRSRWRRERSGTSS
jgi:hypothetical protein